MVLNDYSILDDHSLVKMVIEGDSFAFDTLFARHRDMIYATLLKFTGNSDDVEDLMQEAFMKAYLKIGLYNPKYDFGAWIYTIAKNLTFNELNKRKREISLDFDGKSKIGGHYTIDDKVTSPLLSIIYSELNQVEIQIITLHLISGFKHREIADMLEKPLGTILWTYKNALNKIKSKYKKEDL